MLRSVIMVLCQAVNECAMIMILLDSSTQLNQGFLCNGLVCAVENITTHVDICDVLRCVWYKGIHDWQRKANK